MQLKENQKITFNTNIGLEELKEIPAGISFNCNSSVDLRKLETIPNNTVFNNKYFVYLDILKKLPSGVIFKNKQTIYLNKKVDLFELTLNELIHLSNKLTAHPNYLNKKDLLPHLREFKLNKIL